jgi:hypothetical protein
MIYLVITGISHHQSSQISTTIISYSEEKDPIERKQGAEWEEVEFTIKEEEKPTIIIGNISGDAYPVHPLCKIIINNPRYFGLFRVGDIIPFVPIVDKSNKSIDIPKINSKIGWEGGREFGVPSIPVTPKRNE